jgi:ABC-type glycerol-3-phosphate transport system permease component
VFFFPFVWMVLSSFKTHDRMTEYPPVFQFEATLDNDRYAFQQAQFFECTNGFFEEVPIELEEAAMITTASGVDGSGGAAPVHPRAGHRRGQGLTRTPRDGLVPPEAPR